MFGLCKMSHSIHFISSVVWTFWPIELPFWMAARLRPPNVILGFDCECSISFIFEALIDFAGLYPLKNR